MIPPPYRLVASQGGVSPSALVVGDKKVGCLNNLVNVEAPRAGALFI